MTDLGGDLQAFLVASYCYYIMDKPVMSDGDYDALAERLRKNWNAVKHPHKKLVDVASLKAGTLYKLKAEGYPGIVKGAAEIAVARAYGCSCPILLREQAPAKGRAAYKCPACETTYSWSQK